MNEQVDFTSDVCIHTECDCNCMTAKEKRLRAQLDAANLEMTEKLADVVKLTGENAGLHSKILQLESSLARMKKTAKEVMDLLQEYGAEIVPHLIDTDENPGQRLREALQESSEEIKK